MFSGNVVVVFVVDERGSLSYEGRRRVPGDVVKSRGNVVLITSDATAAGEEFSLSRELEGREREGERRAFVAHRGEAVLRVRSDIVIDGRGNILNFRGEG